jgi:CheY-like chemotaxis protein
VLVVDDDGDSRQLLALILGTAGAIVDTASSAAEAFDLLQAVHYDLLLADIAMPGEDGFSLVSRWRALGSRHELTPAVAVTAHAREQDKDRALSVGFSAHLAKPVDAQRLLDVAAGVLTRAEITEAAEPSDMA